MWPLGAAMSLVAWICFFGGLGPKGAISRADISALAVDHFFVAQALYFLACIGVYYCLPEAILFGVTSLRSPELWAGWRIPSALALLLAAAFIAFPPLQNIAEFAVPTMGYLDIAARWVLDDYSRILLFYIFALWTVVRFATARNPLPVWLLSVNALVMIKAPIAWDKYALPLICVLWLLRAYGAAAPADTLTVRNTTAATTRHSETRGFEFDA